ncbi:3-deoxy-D-manno-octulosonic acid transferase [Candidatus Pelagibacter sp.]|uniref:3-deoxy-D-manno-octulosonic acid transferase n=1 Tax=Candidatus Pelagibacter sp. TaxID=2024849 RepID=UPI003F82F997
MLFIYQLIISILLLISPIILLIRILRKKENIKSLKEKFSFNSKRRVNGKLIWFHGASVGEVLSIIPIIKHYEKDKSIKQILVTSSTLSSLKVIKKFNFKKTIHQFYPIDHFIFNNKFINYWKPSLGIFVDSEIWPMMFQNLKYKNIPIILLNARLTKKTFSRWIKIKSFAKSVFNKITVAYPQNKETNLYLKELDVRNIITIGNLKFSENSDENLNNISKKLKSELDKKKIWVASSTHKTEEIFCAKAHLKLKKKITNLLTIIIPRHIHRANEITNQIKNLNLKIALHSSKPKNLKNVDIYLVDTFGETKKFHQIGNTVFLGGSIIKRGGQNPLEATRLGAKILHGPNTDNFKDVYKHLKLLNISKKINTPLQLASSIIFKKNKNSGKKIKQIGKKILKKTINELDNLINNEYKKT